MPARRYTIRGRVQGVFFRDSTRHVATPLGLTGHAINLANGDVEVLAVGEVEALDELEAWLKRGPPLANVVEVRVEECQAEPLLGFTTG